MKSAEERAYELSHQQVWSDWLYFSEMLSGGLAEMTEEEICDYIGMTDEEYQKMLQGVQRRLANA